eukprot:TRINITY_DN17340_c0_g1_i3.p3 TRINITY_DN17340_c0_g1~~TRINITY_DN17340_c0_g1_i3.p3  ORF type:complete len:279 (+),score=81.41 TRINITY_DN17340_c0_g1_i3:403-1239(+)
MALLGDGDVLFAARDADEPFVGCTASSGASQLPATAFDTGSAFVASKVWRGVRTGYYFGTAAAGLGYHRDVETREPPSPVQKQPVPKAELSDLLDKYGGAQHLGRPKDVHALAGRAQPPRTGADVVAAPPCRWDSRRTLPQRPDADTLAAERAAREAKEARQARKRDREEDDAAKRAPQGCLAAVVALQRAMQSGSQEQRRADVPPRPKQPRLDAQDRVRSAEEAAPMPAAATTAAAGAPDRKPQMSKRARKRQRQRQDAANRAAAVVAHAAIGAGDD